MRTFDRTQGFQEHIAPGTRRNYLRETLTNFQRAGVFDSPELRQFYLVDSGSVDKNFLQDQAGEFYPITYDYPSSPRTPNENAGRALELGAASGAPWVLFCEDDLDVVSDFLDGIVAWLNRNAREDRRLYTFGSAAVSPDAEGEIQDVTVEAFFGTTCYAMRSEDARSMSEYITQNPFYNGGRFYGKGGVPVAHDLHYHQWSRALYPDINFFAASCPSFVQHVGVESAISNRSHEITYKSWPGRDWRYRD